MALNTFEPTIPPAPGTSAKPQVKILEAEFGDGYSQATPDGINHIRQVLELNWQMLHPQHALEIIDFMEGQLGTTPFYYTPSDEEDALKWTCKEWANVREKNGLRSVNLTLVQSFTLEE